MRELERGNPETTAATLPEPRRPAPGHPLSDGALAIVGSGQRAAIETVAPELSATFEALAERARAITEQER